MVASELRHLHDRPLQAAERLRQGRGVGGVASLDAEQPGAGDPRRDPADIGADAGIARGAGGKAVGFGIAFGHRLAFAGSGFT